MSDIAISARGLGKRYRRLTKEGRHDSLRDLIGASASGMFASKAARDARRERQTFWALKDVDFDVRRGENLGVIGLNGAGKSTLLKILSRITTPTDGTANISGRLGALLEVGTGFHHELTGRENIFLYGSILGMPRTEVQRKFDAIVAFSEIEEFLDTPVKRYSSGMYVRLAFAVAAHLDPDILLLDEVLAVGDFAFQRKCMNFAQGLEKKGATILFVSHNMFSIKTMCDRVIYLKKGRVEFDGPTIEGLKLYEDDSRLSGTPWFDNENSPIKFTDVAFFNERGQPSTVFDHGERMIVRLRYHASRRITQPDFRVSIEHTEDIAVSTYSSMSDGIDIPYVEGDGELELTTPPLKLVSDLYRANIIVRDAKASLVSAQIGGHFHVRHPLYTFPAFGLYHEPGEWRMRKAEAPATETKDNVRQHS